MKKILTILLSLLLLASLISCTDRQGQKETDGQTPMHSGNPFDSQTNEPSGTDAAGETNPDTASDSPEPQTTPDNPGGEMPLDPENGDDSESEPFPTNPSGNDLPDDGAFGDGTFSEGTFGEPSFEN